MEKIKKPFYKRWWFIVIVALIVLGGIGNALGGDTEKNVVKENPEPKEKQQEVKKVEEKVEEPVQEVVAEPATVEERVELFIIKKFKDKTNMDKNRIVSITNSEGTLEIVLNGDDNFTSNMIRTGMLSKSTDLFKEVSSYYKDGDVSIGWMFTMIDQYGNENEQKVISIRMSQETMNKVNWDNFNYNNYASVADVYSEHPAFNSK